MTLEQLKIGQLYSYPTRDYPVRIIKIVGNRVYVQSAVPKRGYDTFVVKYKSLEVFCGKV